MEEKLNEQEIKSCGLVPNYDELNVAIANFLDQKLQDGDYVSNLTEDQFNELMKIYSLKFSYILLTYKASSSKCICFNGEYFQHGAYKNELTFKEFKRRAINTFGK